MQLVLVFLTLFVCCTFSQTNFKLAGNALVEFKNYKGVCNQVSGAVGVDAAISAKITALKAGIATDAEAKAFLVTALNGKVATLVTAFVDANAAAKAQIDEAAQFAVTIGAVKSVAIDASADAVTSAGVILDKIQARTAILLKAQAAAATEIDLAIKQWSALLAQETQAFVAAQAAGAFDALKAKIATSTVVAGDITADILVGVAAKVELLDLFAKVKATADVLTELKAKIADLPRAIAVDATLKAKATAVTAAEAVADIKAKGREFFAAKACKTVHIFRELVAAFGADVNAAIRITLVSRLRDLLIDELAADLASLTDITVTLNRPTASVTLNVAFTAAAAVDATAFQNKIKALVLAFINAHCHPFKLEVKALTATGITVDIFASAPAAGAPVVVSLASDDTEATAQAKFRADVTAAVAAGTDADFTAFVKTSAAGLGALITAIDASITSIGQAITTLDASVKAAVTATMDAFAKVQINLLDTAVANFKTEVFASADIQARARIAAAQIKEAYGTLLLRVKQDLLDLSANGKFVARFEVNLKKQLAAALNDRNAAIIPGALCTQLGTFDVSADFDEDKIEVFMKSNAKCVEYGPIFAKILSLKRQLLQAVVANKAHAAFEASVKTQVDVVTAKYTKLKAEVEAQLTANFAAKKDAAALVGVWVDGAVAYKTCVKGCLSVLGRGTFGANIDFDVAATATATYKHTATATSLDLSASVAVKADVEVKLAAYLPICITQCTGGDGSYCKEKSKVEPTTKRQDGAASASQLTNTEPVANTPTSGSSTVVISALALLGVIAHYFM